MPAWPSEHEDNVLYEEKEIIANNDVVLRTIDGASTYLYGDELTIIFVQDATGGRTVAWGTGFPVKTWTPDATANAVSVARFIAHSNNFYRIT